MARTKRTAVEAGDDERNGNKKKTATLRLAAYSRGFPDYCGNFVSRAMFEARQGAEVGDDASISSADGSSDDEWFVSGDEVSDGVYIPEASGHGTDDPPTPGNHEETIQFRAGESTGGLEGRSAEVLWSQQEDDMLVAAVAKAEAESWKPFWPKVYDAFSKEGTRSSSESRKPNAVKYRYIHALDPSLARRNVATPV